MDNKCYPIVCFKKRFQRAIQKAPFLTDVPSKFISRFDMEFYPRSKAIICIQNDPTI